TPPNEPWAEMKTVAAAHRLRPTSELSGVEGGLHSRNGAARQDGIGPRAGRIAFHLVGEAVQGFARRPRTAGPGGGGGPGSEPPAPARPPLSRPRQEQIPKRPWLPRRARADSAA